MLICLVFLRSLGNKEVFNSGVVELFKSVKQLVLLANLKDGQVLSKGRSCRRS